MAAMEIVLANMIHEADTPVTNTTGGTSAGDPSGGGSDIGRTEPQGSIIFAKLTTGDRAGAIICTVLICSAVLTAVLFMITDENKSAAENWDDFSSSFAKSAGAGVLVKRGRLGSVDEKGKGVERSDSENSGIRPIMPAVVQLPPTRNSERQQRHMVGHALGSSIIAEVPESAKYVPESAKYVPESAKYVPDSASRKKQRRSLQKRDKKVAA
jgi:hypothetical protein